MNCHQVEKFLPLYASHDLAKKTEWLIGSHLQSCVSCADAAAEYRNARQLLQDFASPAFSEDVYAEMREAVWRRIETESPAPSFSELIGAWFRPRLGWAVVTVGLLAVFALGIYFMSNRRTGQQPLAVTPAKVDAGKGQQEQSALPGFSLASSRGNNSPRDQRPPQKRMRSTEVRDRTNSVSMTASSGPPALLRTSTPNGSIPSGAAVNSDTQKTLRLEIQTKNPNIRIIWFAQQGTTQVSPNSKGT